jgi:ATP-dependent DNA helicase RecG
VAIDVEIVGPIPTALLAAQQHVRNLVPTRRALGPDGRFQEIALIPEDAWLEGIVNAAIHRSYSLAGDHVRVEIFPDRIEVESPGRAPGLVRLEDPLNTNRFARNPRITLQCIWRRPAA